MIGWFDLFHYTLVGLGVILLFAIVYAGWQKVVELIVLIHSKGEKETVRHMVSEEHEVHHHVHHLSYTEEPKRPVQAAKTVRTPPVDYQRVPQGIERPRTITQIERR